MPDPAQTTQSDDRLLPGSGRTAVVTGASSGIGAATAARLAAEGFDVVVAARRVDRLQELATSIGARAVALDITDQASVDAFAASLDRVDVLVNNAGVTVERGWWWDDPDPLRVLRVNLETPVEMVRLVLPEMKARRSGHIVNIGSVAGRAATNGMYSASKFGIRGFSLGLRRELLGTGISVSLVSPGFVKSEMTAGASLPMPGPEVVARAVAEVLLKPQREVIVPAPYRVLALLDSVAPALADVIVRRFIIQRRYRHDGQVR